MPSEEPYPTDASTVQRNADPVAVPESAALPLAADGHHASDRPGSSVADGASGEAALNVDQVAQAKTVIRGSSRVKKPSDRLEALGHTPASVARVLLGQRLKHFLLEELIGGGGMGAVFRAHDEQLDRTVAIKVIPFVGDDPDLQRRFRNEAQSAAKLDHPRIARVFDAGVHDEWHYIVFEFIQGTNVRDLVTVDGVMTIDEAVYYTSQLADALQHAADRGIVHRDIKPSNILISTEGRLKLVDMGLARSENIELSEDMTASGVTLGTFDYISPEQAHDPRDADLRSDIYSLGCTLYFMLTGSPPYPGGTMLQKLLSHGNAPPPDPREVRPEVSENLVAVLNKMLAKKPADRYQSANDLIADLHEVAIRDRLTRAQSLGPAPPIQTNAMSGWVETYSHWIGAVVLFVLVASWMHVGSMLTRETIAPAPDAYPPQRVSSAAAGDVGVRVGPPSVSGSVGRPTLDSIDGERAAADAEPEYVGVERPETIEERFVPRKSLPVEFSDSIDPFPPTISIDAGSVGAESSGLIAASDRVAASDDESEVMATRATNVVRLVDSSYRTGEPVDVDGAVLARSFTAALQQASSGRASRIEIATATVYAEPVAIESDLLITSTIGGSTIIFQPMDSVAMERSRMISVGEHQVEFDDLHFVWNVPSGDIDGGTLFQLNDNRLVRLTDCVITVNNPTQREEVYAFDVITDPDRLPRERRDEVDGFPLVSVELNNVIVRGQMSMLHMDYGAELWLYWDNGLLAVSRHLVDTAGSRVEPSRPMLLWLSRVTAHASSGLVRMRVGVSGPYPVPIDRDARKSVFVVDSGAPHFDVTGVESVDPSLLRLRGSSNAYLVESGRDDPLLRMVAVDGETVWASMSDFADAAPIWEDETSPRWSVEWENQGLPDRPESRRTPADYRQNDLAPPGFDEMSLPVDLIEASGPNDVSNGLTTRPEAESEAEPGD